MREFSGAEIEALERLNLNGPSQTGESPFSSPRSTSKLAPSKATGTITGGIPSKAQKVDIAKLEEKAEAAAVNGKA